MDQVVRMKRNLVQTGNSKALIITREMREHLGIADEVDIQFRRNSIVIRNPNATDEDDEPKKPSKADKKAKK